MGRPPTDTPRTRTVYVKLTNAEMSNLDAVRGDVTRAEYMAMASGVRTDPKRTCTGCVHNTGKARWTCPPQADAWVSISYNGAIDLASADWPPNIPACPCRKEPTP